MISQKIISLVFLAVTQLVFPLNLPSCQNENEIRLVPAIHDLSPLRAKAITNLSFTPDLHQKAFPIVTISGKKVVVESNPNENNWLPGVKDSPTEIVIQFIMKLNEGKYNQALKLFPYNILEQSNETFESFKNWCDEYITKNKSVSKVIGIDERVRKDHTVKVDIKIIYQDGTSIDVYTYAIKLAGKWHVLEAGTLM